MTSESYSNAQVNCPHPPCALCGEEPRDEPREESVFVWGGAQGGERVVWGGAQGGDVTLQQECMVGDSEL